MSRWFCAVFAASSTLVSTLALVGAAHAEPALRLEATAGYDSNATRSEGDLTTGASAARLVADLAAADRLGRDWRVDGAWHGGGVHFFDAARQSEDAVFQRLDAALRGRLTRELTLGATVDLRDRTTRDPRHPRDFTLIRGAAPLGYRLGGVGLELAPVGERFHYKPSARYDATSVGGRARVSWSPGAWQLSTHGELLWRDYRGGDEGRASDQLRRIGAGVRYTGTWLWSAAYGFSDNDSTRLEGGYDRHAVTLTATAPLPGALLLSGRVSLVRILHAEAQLLPDGQTLEDEGRSAITLRLERPVTERWSLVAHGGWWGSPFATGPEYERWLGLLGVSYGQSE